MGGLAGCPKRLADLLPGEPLRFTRPEYLRSGKTLGGGSDAGRSYGHKKMRRWSRHGGAPGGPSPASVRCDELVHGPTGHSVR